MEQSNPIELEMLRKLLGAGSFLLFLPSYFYFSTKPCHCIEDWLVQLCSWARVAFCFSGCSDALRSDFSPSAWLYCSSGVQGQAQDPWEELFIAGFK